jgi:hypothetical protein
VLLLLALMEAVIPGRPEGPSPESIFTDRGYGFRLPRCAPKSAVADLGNQTPISGKPEIGRPGMTTARLGAAIQNLHQLPAARNQ